MIRVKKAESKKSKGSPQDGDSFRNRILVSMPALGDVFNRSIIYVCDHNEKGAMGIILNQKLPGINFSDLLGQLNMPKSELKFSPEIHFGGPIDSDRGFVLHSTDFLCANTIKVDENMAVTGTIDILREIAKGAGPNKSVFALGHAGWGPGQLDKEIYNNDWIVIEADEDLIFNTHIANKWEKAMSKIGVNPHLLSDEAGHS